MFIKKFNRFDPALPTFLHSDENGGGGGNAANPITPKQETTDERDARILAEVQKKFDEQSARHSGDLTAALLDQIRKTHSAENAKSTSDRLKSELERQLPDDATKAKWAAYEAFGTPDQIAAQIQRAKRADELERDQACRLAGIDPADLSTRKGVDDWKMEVKSEEVDGKTVEVAYVTIEKDGKPETKPLAEHAFTVFPSLAKSDAAAAQTSGTPHVKQVSGQQRATAPLTFEERKARKMAQSDYPTM